MHSDKSPKTAVIAVVSTLFLLAVMSMPSVVSAQQSVAIGDTRTSVADTEPLDQAKLDQLLAPIALYPDSLLSQILVAATYPLEVVQANRWRRANLSLSETQVLDAIEDKQWDPSVKALTPFTDLLARLSKDLDWLQRLGDAFLQNEEQVLASVQDLRQKARDHGSIADNDYFDVVEEADNIIIKSTRRDIVYVPYYDSRAVYGHWGWRDYQPVYWHRPSHFHLHAGFYWSDQFYIRPTLFFGGFHWNLRNLVVNHHFYDRPYRYNHRHRNNRVSDYRRWNHNPVHRRGVRYSRNGDKHSFYRNRYNSRYRASRAIRDHDQRRRSNVVTSNPRNRDGNRRIERDSIRQQQRRDNLRIERRDRDNAASDQQRWRNRVQRTTDTRVVQNQQSNRSRTTNYLNATGRQSTHRAARNDANGNRSNSAPNVRRAPVANTQPTRPARQADTSRNGNKSNSNNNRSSTRNASNYNPRHNGSNIKPHRQPN